MSSYVMSYFFTAEEHDFIKSIKPEEQCHIRLIFASVALGMGVDL